MKVQRAVGHDRNVVDRLSRNCTKLIIAVNPQLLFSEFCFIMALRPVIP
jgi:hypothetical protein